MQEVMSYAKGEKTSLPLKKNIDPLLHNTLEQIKSQIGQLSENMDTKHKYQGKRRNRGSCIAETSVVQGVSVSRCAMFSTTTTDSLPKTQQLFSSLENMFGFLDFSWLPKKLVSAAGQKQQIP